MSGEKLNGHLIHPLGEKDSHSKYILAIVCVLNLRVFFISSWKDRWEKNTYIGEKQKRSIQMAIEEANGM